MRDIASIRRSAESGFALDQYRLALTYLKKGKHYDATEALVWLNKAAKWGLALAQDRLGLCYQSGEGVEANPTVAVEYFRQAADQGLALANFHIGLCYQRGYGFPRNDAKAAKILTKAANNDLGLAQLELAFCYLNGRGVIENRETAFHWLNKAADNGIGQAKRILAAFRSPKKHTDQEGVSKHQNFVAISDPTNTTDMVADALSEFFSTIRRGDNAFVIFSIAPENEFYIQCCTAGDEGDILAEAVSNIYLPAEYALTKKQVKRLVELHWDENSDGNYTRMYEHSKLDISDLITRDILAAFSEVYCINSEIKIEVEIGSFD